MFENLKKQEKSSLCELLIVRSLIDLIDYDFVMHKTRWNGVKKKPNQFIVGLDFIASGLGYYSWKQIFYSKQFSSNFEEDQEIEKILCDFAREKRGRIDIPKITDFSSKSNAQLREKIINSCLTPDVLEKTKRDYVIFEISKDGKSLIIDKEIVDSFDPINLIYSNISNNFRDPLPSFTLIKKRSLQHIRKKDFDKIKEIQDNLCFYCDKKLPLVKDHYIPETFLHETNPSNIVGSCKKCNRKKWFIEPPKQSEFDKILKRNDDHPSILERSYTKEKYKEQYERFKEIIFKNKKFGTNF